MVILLRTVKGDEIDDHAREKDLVTVTTGEKLAWFPFSETIKL